ncbi:hypothetical protein [Streptomyces sp. NBC_01243]|uniref:hypothetical protein n=1 Tax=Streptomyces sp. NBC_01243 TaxID=2903796 RepID=UPI000F97BC6E|nr:hypothetical protein EES42_17850 [Streptomyces sp. ADI95-17]WSP50628.1 hypothetical protein OG348_34850 [Streptomyces sp. NBC_01243]
MSPALGRAAHPSRGAARPGAPVEEALLEGIPESLKEWEKITVDLDQATSLATNGLPLGPDVYVTDPEFSFLGQEIERFGVHVEYVEFSITRSLGGSFRCGTQPLLRKF